MDAVLSRGGTMEVPPKVTDATPAGCPEPTANEETPSSFADLYGCHHPMVRRVLFKLVGTRDLDDAVQEAFVRIWRGLPKFDRRSSLKTWIYSVTIRAGIDHLRRIGRRGFLTVVDPEWPSAADEERDHVNRDLVRRGLGSLSIDHRAALVLMVYEGLSIGEIAMILSIHEGTVKSRLHYARKFMADFLERNGVRL
jgi:RNA polymerase sigma-70 factor (ECF subfamily)